MISIKPSFTPSSRQAWHRWLTTNHATKTEVWLVYYKKQAGKQTISYADSLEEALCFGWIDGLIRKIDEDRYARRFTPRKAASRWSPTNLKLAAKLIKAGAMTAQGLAVYNNGKPYDFGVAGNQTSDIPTLPPAMEKELKRHKEAWAFFESLTPGHKRRYVGWLASAKKEETQKKRLKEAIKLLSEKQKLEMK